MVRFGVVGGMVGEALFRGGGGWGGLELGSVMVERGVGVAGGMVRYACGRGVMVGEAWVRGRYGWGGLG